MKTNSLKKPQFNAVQLFLRIKHPTIDPKLLTDVLQMKPDHAVSAGESIAANGNRKLHSESYWIAQLSLSSAFSAPTADVLNDYKKLLTTSSVEEKVAIQKRSLARSARLIEGLSKSELLDIGGASPIELIIAAPLRKLAAHSEFIKSLVADGGTATLVVQLRAIEHPIRIRPSLAKRLLDLSLELEIDCAP
jgi:hypothetical protein